MRLVSAQRKVASAQQNAGQGACGQGARAEDARAARDAQVLRLQLVLPLGAKLGAGSWRSTQERAILGAEARADGGWRADRVWQQWWQ